jgi:preprotein translocase subunit YajC
MENKAKFKIGDEVLVDGAWATVQKVDGDYVYVIDEDGNDQYVARSTVEHYYY